MNNPEQDRGKGQVCSGPLGIRSRVWYLVGGSLLTFLFLVKLSAPHATAPAVQDTAPRPAEGSPQPHDTPQGPSPAPAYPPRAAIGGGAGSVHVEAAISNELSRAEEALVWLRRTYADGHPEVVAQLQAIRSLKFSLRRPGETLELALVRAELAKAEVNYGPEHPYRRSQQAIVETLEQRAATGEGPDR